MSALSTDYLLSLISLLSTHFTQYPPPPRSAEATALTEFFTLIFGNSPEVREDLVAIVLATLPEAPPIIRAEQQVRARRRQVRARRLRRSVPSSPSVSPAPSALVAPSGLRHISSADPQNASLASTPSPSLIILSSSSVGAGATLPGGGHGVAAAGQEDDDSDSDGETDTDCESTSGPPAINEREDSLDPINTIQPQRPGISSGTVLRQSYGNMQYLCYLFAGALRAKREGSKFDNFDITGLDFQQRYSVAIGLEHKKALLAVRSIYLWAGMAREWMALARSHLTTSVRRPSKSGRVRENLVPDVEVVRLLGTTNKKTIGNFRRRMLRYSLYEEVRLKFEAYLLEEPIVSVFGFHRSISE